MFDKTVILPARRDTQFVTREVHEHRAPTDDSVRLLREMEAKAFERITQTTTVSDTAFECVVHHMRELHNNRDLLAAVFSMNGKKMRVDVSLPSHDAKELPSKLRDAIAEKIATDILIPAFQKAGL